MRRERGGRRERERDLRLLKDRGGRVDISKGCGLAERNENGMGE